MNTAALIVLIIVLVIVIAGIGLLAFRWGEKRRSERLKERFGPEYDHAVRRADDQRSAETELIDREKRHRSLELRELEPGQRREFEQRWADVQRDFVDGPGRAVSRADRLVVEVMSARGYPVDDFDQRADDLSVQYPEVTARYREARAIATANERGEADTEDLRGAVTGYRALVEALLGDHRDDERGTHGEHGTHGGRATPDERGTRGRRADGGEADERATAQPTARSSERESTGQAATTYPDGQEDRA
jgi:hypothetical protein